MEKDSLIILNFQLEKVMKNSKCEEDLGKGFMYINQTS